MVLLRIADQTGHHGENAWPGIKTIANDCNISPRQVQKCINGLVDLGEMLVFPNAGGSKDCPADRRPNRYEMPLMDGWVPPQWITPKNDPFSYMKAIFELEPAETDEVNCATPREVNPTTPRIERDEPHDTPGVNSRVERGELQGSNGVNPTTPDMPLDPSLKKSSSAREAERPDFSDWKPAATTIRRIKMMKPKITDEFLTETIPEFLTYAEGHYRRDQLESKFISNAHRQYLRSTRKTGEAVGLPKDNNELAKFALDNGLRGARPGESYWDYRSALKELMAA